jgi:peptide/nickel transport system permease protein
MQPEVKRKKVNGKRRFAYFYLGLLVFIALFADLLASNAPLYARYKGNTIFPAFRLIFHRDYALNISDQNGRTEVLQYGITDWRRLNFENVLWPPVTYSPGFADPYNRDYRSPSGQQFIEDSSGKLIAIPSRFRHWLGTDKIGRDVAAGIIHASRISLLLGLLSMLIASLTGVLLGTAAGYTADNNLITRGRILWMLIGIWLAWFYGFYTRRFTLEDAASSSTFDFLIQFIISGLIAAIIVFIFRRTSFILSRIKWLSKPVRPPAAGLIQRLIEITDTLPAILLLLTIGSLFREKSIWLLIWMIGLTSWTVIARLTRAETLRIRRLGYIESARAVGLSRFRIITRHILPNAMGPVYVAIAFGIAGAILLEASLSFLGLGLPPEIVSWGSLLGEARDNFSAWWMIVFPGLELMLTVLAFNLLGESLREK